MSKFQLRGKLITGVVSASMLLSALATPTFAAKLPGAGYSTYQLEAAPTKITTYYKAGSPAIPAIDWVTDASALKFLPLHAIGDVTGAVLDHDGVYWIGTKNGLQRVNFNEKDKKDIVQYFAGPRYLYGGDNSVTGVASDENGGVWARTNSGVTHIEMPLRTMEEKSSVYERTAHKVNERLGYVAGNAFTFVDLGAGSGVVDYSSSTGEFIGTPDYSDNEGLWTSMYAMGLIFRYATLKEDYASSPTPELAQELDAVKAAAVRSTKAVLMLDYVSGRGDGFPVRSYLVKNIGTGTSVSESVYRFQSANGFYFEHFVGPDQVNPNGIIPRMKRDDMNPIGYSMVKVTGDAMTKKGSKLFPSGGNDSMNYNGLGLSQEAIDELNLTRPDGQKLGIDIKTIIGKENDIPIYQVMPVITAGTNGVNAYADQTTSESNKPLFQLTAPVYEQIPAFFNDLLPPSAIVNGQIDMNQIVYKADTSSDSLNGQYALLFTAYKYLIGHSQDTDLLALKYYVEEATQRLTNLILADDHYYVVDATGKSTQWTRWLAKYFNDSLSVMERQVQWQANVGVDANGEDSLSYGYEDGPLKALEVLGALKTAIVVTADRFPADNAKYRTAYDLAFDSMYSKEDTYINGKGYINMALEYIDRRIVRQATDAYSSNDNKIVNRETWDKNNYPSKAAARSSINATIHNDWTQYINYSDEQLGWFPVFTLALAEEDPIRRKLIAEAFDQWYANEVREENPFYTFLYQLVHPDKKDVDIPSAVRYLYRLPQYQITFPIEWNRQDVFYIEPGYRDKAKQTNYAVAPDERRTLKNNTSPFEANDQLQAADPNYKYDAGFMEVGSVFTLPYWIGRYFEIIAEE